MAKKYQQRTHVSVRKKKEEEKKLAQRRAFYAKHRKQILIGIAALVLVIVLGSLAWDYFYAPNGSMRVFMGNLIGAEETDIIKDLGTSSKPRYYKLGAMETPEGYEEGDYGLTTTAVSFDQKFYFVATDEAKTINNVYIAGVPNKTGAQMMEVLASNEMYAMQTEARTAEIAGHPVTYLYAQNMPNSEDETIYYSSLVIYADTIQNSSVLINCSSAHAPLDQVPTEEAMLAEVEGILSCLTINK
ncbi:MAG: hypothetical protein E7329_00470 [Clostridiales bacterium]|nr:hypothetical protein [Clostridiales bacterium]